MGKLVQVIRNQLLLRLGIGVVAQEETIKVRVGALKESHVRAVVASKSFGVEFPAPVAARHIVRGCVTQAVAGALQISGVRVFKRVVLRDAHNPAITNFEQETNRGLKRRLLGTPFDRPGKTGWMKNLKAKLSRSSGQSP